MRAYLRSGARIVPRRESGAHACDIVLACGVPPIMVLFEGRFRRARPNKTMAKKSKKVAILFPVGLPHLAEVLQGLLDYAREHTRWTLLMSPEYTHLLPKALRYWPVDGAIAELSTQALLRDAKHMMVPLVNLSGAIRHAGLPRVTSDNRAIGQMAADHLLACGFRQFGYYGLRRVWYSAKRMEGFAKRIKEAQGPDACSVLESSSGLIASSEWLNWMTSLERRIRTLKPPVGVLAVDDMRAVMVADACERLGLRVPDDVAIVGVNNDPVVCEFSSPPISSIARNGRRVGYEVAALLDRLMAGKRPPEDDVLIPPEGVVAAPLDRHCCRRRSIRARRRGLHSRPSQPAVRHERRFGPRAGLAPLARSPLPILPANVTAPIHSPDAG